MKYFYFLLFIIFVSCQTETKQVTAEQKKDTVIVVKDTIQKDTVAEATIANRYYNDLARFIGGLPLLPESTIDSNLVKKKEWKLFSESFNKKWQKFESTRLSSVKNWQKKELKDVNPKTLFYPFSGPDVLNAHAFFPKAEEFILVGLEPVGSLPNLKDKTFTDSLSNYYDKINQSLYAILNFSFFRTLSMKDDLTNDELNGTLHLMMLFLERTNNQISDVNYVSVDTSGSLQYYTQAFDSTSTVKNKGVEIQFIDTDSTMKKLYYFSINLHDSGFKKNKGFKKFISDKTEVTAYLKSASYLMHKSYFSAIRNLILEKSKSVLQDDSGIPYKYFEKEKWDVTLYGSYSAPIPMFDVHTQEDLKLKYSEDSLKIQRLNFGIGYSYKGENKSNLLLGKRK